MVRSLILLIILLSLTLLGCVQHDLHLNHSSVQVEENKTKENKTITVVDDLGYNVTVKLYPERIVSLAPSNTEILFALGLGDKVVGVTDYCNYPPEVVKLKEEGKIKSIGGYTTVNVEKVAELKPDLVVAHSGNGIGTIEAIRKLGIPVVCLDPKNFEDIMRDIELLGKITGAEDNATKLIEFMKRKIEEVKEIVSKAEDRPRVVHIVWHDPIWVSGKGTFVDELITLAGGVNAINESGWVTIDEEGLIALNPDVIIVNSGTGMGGSDNIIYEWIMSNERLKVIKAVKENRVYIIDADLASRPSHRLVYALEEFARFIHPELFEQSFISSAIIPLIQLNINKDLLKSPIFIV